MKTRPISLVAMVVLVAVLALMAADGGVSVSSAKPANTWSSEQFMPVSRLDHVAATGTDSNGEDRMFVIAGQSGGQRTTRVDGYNANTLSWAVFAPLPTERERPTETVGFDGRIYIIGGAIAFIPLGIVEAYNPATDTWATISSLNIPRKNAAAATGPDGKIYVFGGTNPNAAGSFNTVEVFDPNQPAQGWTFKQQMPVGRSGIGAVRACNGKIYVFGGSRVDAYNPATDTWTTGLASPPQGADGHTATLGPDGLVYVFNGATAPFTEDSGRNAWSYNPIANIWDQIDDPIFGRFFWAAATLGDQVYVSGGTIKFGGDTSAVQAFGSIATSSPCAVGGIEVPFDDSDLAAGQSASSAGSSAPPYAALAGAVAAAVALVTAGAWYARRRWLR